MLALSMGLCWSAAGRIQPTYEATTSLVLVPPKDPESPLTNRFLLLGGLNDSVAVLARTMQSADTVKAVQHAAPGATYTVAPDVTTSAPILVVSVSGSDEAAAKAMMAALMSRVPENLAALQADLQISPDRQIAAKVVSSGKPAANQKARLRVLAVVAVGLLFISAVTVAAVDGLFLRRRQRLDDREPEDAEPTPERPRLVDATSNPVPTSSNGSSKAERPSKSGRPSKSRGSSNSKTASKSPVHEQVSDDAPEQTDRSAVARTRATAGRQRRGPQG
jgi:hypothetical protein